MCRSPTPPASWRGCRRVGTQSFHTIVEVERYVPQVGVVSLRDGAISRHAAAVRRGGFGTISLLYFSGHGAADPDTRTNYLIPVYAQALAEELVKPGIEALTMVRRVALRVNPQIGQTLGCRRRLAGGVPRGWAKYRGQPCAGQRSRGGVGGGQGHQRPHLLEALISRFKDSFYADLARSRLKQLKEAKIVMATPPDLQVAVTASRPKSDRSGDACIPRTCSRTVRAARKWSLFQPVTSSWDHQQGNRVARTPRLRNTRWTIAKPFAVGRYAVTRGEYATFMQETQRATGEKCWTLENGKFEVQMGLAFRNPGFTQNDQHPAVCVNWDDAKAFTAWLSNKTGKSYRLLSGRTRVRDEGRDNDALCLWQRRIVPLPVRQCFGSDRK
jgi:hypothetical protein